MASPAVNSLSSRERSSSSRKADFMEDLQKKYNVYFMNRSYPTALHGIASFLDPKSLICLYCANTYFYMSREELPYIETLRAARRWHVSDVSLATTTLNVTIISLSILNYIIASTTQSSNPYRVEEAMMDSIFALVTSGTSHYLSQLKIKLISRDSCYPYYIPERHSREGKVDYYLFVQTLCDLTKGLAIKSQLPLSVPLMLFSVARSVHSAVNIDEKRILNYVEAIRGEEENRIRFRKGIPPPNYAERFQLKVAKVSIGVAAVAAIKISPLIGASVAVPGVAVIAKTVIQRNSHRLSNRCKQIQQRLTLIGVSIWNIFRRSIHAV